jgi:hypothetical protein
MTGDDNLRLQLSRAAEEFPVHGWPPDLQQRAVRRRRITAGFVLASGLAVAAVAVAVVAISSAAGPETPTPNTAGTSYIGSSWRLMSVAERADTTTIPAGIGAQIDLLPDGQILANDGVNVTTGRFTKTADGFEVRVVAITAALYAGKDPHRLAAIAALGALTGSRQPSLARDTVISTDRTRLVIQAGSFRLTFERTGPATTTPDRPTASGKPS